VVHEHVALAQRGEHALGHLALGEPRMGGRHVPAVLQVRSVHPVHLPERGQVEQPRHPEHRARAHVQLGHQQVEHVRRGGVGHLQPHRRAEPAPGQLPLQRLQQVLVPVLVDLDIGVAGDPEQVVLDHLHAREQQLQMRRDQLLQRQERGGPVVRVGVGAAGHDEPGHVVRHLHPGELLRPAAGVTDEHGQVQRQPADVRERVRRVDRQRGEDGEHLIAEVGAEAPLLAVVQRAPVHDPDALRGQRRLDIVDEAAGVLLHQLLGAGRDAAERVPGGEPVGGGQRQAHLLPALQPGHPDHVELVQVPGEDGEELDPFQQWDAPVLGLGQHPGVEVQPGHLPAVEPVVGQFRGRLDRLLGQIDRNYVIALGDLAERRRDRIGHACSSRRPPRLPGPGGHPPPVHPPVCTATVPPPARGRQPSHRPSAR
jgi:hypothetical protein